MYKMVTDRRAHTHTLTHTWNERKRRGGGERGRHFADEVLHRQQCRTSWMSDEDEEEDAQRESAG